MGRTTFESLMKPLTGRINIIITRDQSYHAPDCFITHSLEEALDLARKRDKKEIFIIGGGQIYHQAINIADKLYLTVVKGNFIADTFFPDYSLFKKVIYQKERKNMEYKFTFLELVR